MAGVGAYASKMGGCRGEREVGHKSGALSGDGSESRTPFPDA